MTLNLGMDVKAVEMDFHVINYFGYKTKNYYVESFIFYIISLDI